MKKLILITIITLTLGCSAIDNLKQEISNWKNPAIHNTQIGTVYVKNGEYHYVSPEGDDEIIDVINLAKYVGKTALK